MNTCMLKICRPDTGADLGVQGVHYHSEGLQISMKLRPNLFVRNFPGPDFECKG